MDVLALMTRVRQSRYGHLTSVYFASIWLLLGDVGDKLDAIAVRIVNILRAAGLQLATYD